MDKIDTLVLSGGGIKCLSILGALSYLIETGIIEDGFKDIKKIHYTSGSSIFTFPLLFGFNIGSAIEIFKDVDWSKIDLTEKMSINNLFTNFGFTDTETYNYVLEVFLENKGIRKDITLKEVYEINKIELNFNVVNVTKDKYESLNYINSPDLPIIKAIRMTSNIPILFKPIEYNGDLFVDGGLIENIKYEELCKNKKSIGIDVIASDLANTDEREDKKNDFKDFKEYLSYLYSIYGSKVYHENLKNHIKIKIPGFGGDIQNYKKDVDDMITNGYETALKHFNNQKQIDSEKKSNEGQKDEVKS
jgi:NTE family protein